MRTPTPNRAGSPKAVETTQLWAVERDAAAAEQLARFRDLEVAVGDLFTGDRSSDAGPTIATRSRFSPVGRPARLPLHARASRTLWPWHNSCPETQLSERSTHRRLKASRSTSTESDGSCAKATSALQCLSRLPGRYCIPPVFVRVVGQYRTFMAEVGSPSPTRWRRIGALPGLS
jgi:hypothetical protein